MKVTLSLFLLSFALAVDKPYEVSLSGSKASLQKQNRVADEEGLVRIKNDDVLSSMKSAGQLVPLPQAIVVDERLESQWQFVLYRTAVFLDDYGVKFINRFGRRLQVNSAVRTIPKQLTLMMLNPNAAGVESDRSSPHLTGATIDIAKIGMAKEELDWMRKETLALERQNLIEVTEEVYQSVFHIMVYNTYLDNAK